MNHDFAVFLRTLRRQRKLSQAVLAQNAHVSERTLRYWETGAASPSQWELESVFKALKLTPQERIQALALLPTRRGMQLSRQGADSLALADKVGPLPMMGDLLQAMRLRHGLTQRQMAAAMKLAHTTILRWEATETLPSEENLERVFALLDAHTEERAALSGRRMQIGDGKRSLSLEECSEQVVSLDSAGVGLQSLIDLRALALKRQLWLMADRSEEAMLLLARVQLIHANWLMLQERKAEAEVCIQRSLTILPGHSGAKPFWLAAVNLAAHFASEGAGGNIAGVQTIQRWLPLFPRERQVTLWCDMALYAGNARQHEAAAGYLARAHEALPYSVNAAEMAEHYYPLTSARVLLSAGHPVEALEWMPSIPGLTQPITFRAFYQFRWAEALLKAGEKDAAQRHVDQLNTLFAESPQPQLQRKLYALAERL